MPQDTTAQSLAPQCIYTTENPEEKIPQIIQLIVRAYFPCVLFFIEIEESPSHLPQNDTVCKCRLKIKFIDILHIGRLRFHFGLHLKVGCEWGLSYTIFPMLSLQFGFL